MKEQSVGISDAPRNEFDDSTKVRPETGTEGRCPECGSPLGFTGTCKECGLVTEKPVMSRRPQKFTDPEGPRPRADRSAGRNPKFMRNGIGHTSFEVKSDLDPEKARLFGRLKKINGQKDGRTKRETRIMIMLDKLAEQLDLPDSVQKRVASLYRKLRRRGLTKGRESRAVLGALTLIESREGGYPRTHWEIVDALNKIPSLWEELKLDSSSESQVDRSSLRSTLKFLREEFGVDVSPTKPIQYLPRFATKLDLGPEEREKAYRISERIGEKMKNTKPTLVTSAILYLASADHTLREVSEELHVSPSALCRRANEIKGILEEHS